MGLYDYYKGQNKSLAPTAEGRFADPAFASAAKSAGYDINSYKVNMGNASANTAIERYLRTPVTTTPTGSTPTPTPTPTPSPTPTPTPTPVTDPNRYVRTPSAKDQAIKDAEDKLNGYVGTEPNEANLIAEKRKQAQAMIDVVNAEFNRTLADEQVAGEGRNSRVRALNVNSGLGGSDFATGAAVDQEKKNSKVVDLINQEKSAKISAILADADSRASEEYKARRLEYVKGLEGNLDRLKEAKDEERAKALGTVKGLAQLGTKLDVLKTSDPATFKQLLEEYGGSELELEAQWNASLPDNLKVKYEQKVISGPGGKAQILRYGVDPQTGKITQNLYDLGVDYSKLQDEQIKEVDGVLYSTSKTNPDGTLTPLTKVSELAKSNIAQNYASADASRASAEKSRADILGGEDPQVTKELQDAQKAIDEGRDPDQVRRMFLDLYPKKADLFLKYTKQQY